LALSHIVIHAAAAAAAAAATEGAAAIGQVHAPPSANYLISLDQYGTACAFGCCCRWFEQAGSHQASCLFYPQPLVVETIKLFAKVSWSNLNQSNSLITSAGQPPCDWTHFTAEIHHPNSQLQFLLMFASELGKIANRSTRG
jgi:hypothetical protein